MRNYRDVIAELRSAISQVRDEDDGQRRLRALDLLNELEKICEVNLGESFDVDDLVSFEYLGHTYHGKIANVIDYTDPKKMVVRLSIGGFITVRSTQLRKTIPSVRDHARRRTFGLRRPTH